MSAKNLKIDQLDLDLLNPRAEVQAIWHPTTLRSSLKTVVKENPFIVKWTGCLITVILTLTRLECAGCLAAIMVRHAFDFSWPVAFATYRVMSVIGVSLEIGYVALTVKDIDIGAINSLPGSVDYFTPNSHLPIGFDDRFTEARHWRGVKFGFPPIHHPHADKGIGSGQRKGGENSSHNLNHYVRNTEFHFELGLL